RCSYRPALPGGGRGVRVGTRSVMVERVRGEDERDESRDAVGDGRWGEGRSYTTYAAVRYEVARDEWLQRLEGRLMTVT
ncbi:MAG: hypothetical protein WAM97_18790, partial [Acidimicrobiales bacterium]